MSWRWTVWCRTHSRSNVLGAVYFYHLTQRPLEVTLPLLLEKALAQEWQVEVRGTSPDRMDWLDQKLWLHSDDGFLPHGLAGGPYDQDQPILLTTKAGSPRACVMCIDGAEPQAAEVSAAQRTCILFDGNDVGAVSVARSQWKSLVDAGCAAKYWSEDSGRWEEKASAGG